MLESGPNGGQGWEYKSTITSRFSQGSDLEVILTIICER